MAKRIARTKEDSPARGTTVGAKDILKESKPKFTGNDLTAESVKSIPELIALLEKDKTIEIEARVFYFNKETGKATLKKISRDKFVESYKKNSRLKTFRETIDYFGTDSVFSGSTIGSEFVPLLGGPFNKQMYLHDMLQQHSQAFYAYNHDPIAKAAVQIMRDFVLGRGWRVDCDDPNALALWRAFEEANDLYNLVQSFVTELSVYGESFFWYLPNNETKIAYKVQPGQEPPKGILPRVRLIDPSVIWEIVTYPEDITRVLYYQWVAPTQYQIYTGSDKGKPVSGSKFIYQQIPPEQVDHYKVNVVSNEKRGRSDLFPVLGYLKRLRDSVNYSILALQKAAAWAIDTEIDGNQTDIDSYISQQQAAGPISPPGSEFIHNTKIKRTYIANEGGAKGGSSQAFEWCLSMICAGLGIPQQYFGTHISGGSNRASAIVATEPVAKRFEMRQLLVENALKKMAKRLFADFGIKAEIEVTFPEIVTQDRTAKLKDLALAKEENWISQQRSAEIAAKELGITNYDYEIEKKEMEAEQQASYPQMPQVFPLSTPGQPAAPEPAQPSTDVSRAATSGAAKRKLDVSRGF